MPFPDLSRGLAHIVLTGSSIWAALQLPNALSCAHGAIGLHFLVGITCILSCLLAKYSNSNLGVKMLKWYSRMFDLAMIFVLPLMATQLYLNGGFRIEYALIHAASALIPFIDNSVSDQDRSLRDAVIAANCLSLCYIGFIQNQLFVYGMAACFAFNYFVIRTKSQIWEFNDTDVYIVVLGLFNFLSIKAL